MWFKRNLLSYLLIIAIALSIEITAAPVTTVPWHGYRGAVSFTFDDGCHSQLTNVIPALKSRNIHATFFLVGVPTSDKTAWIQAARDGNEIGNHTCTHPNLTTISNQDSITKEIVDEAKALRALDTSIQCVTLAYPNCAINTQINAIADQENIIARTCGGDAHFKWGSKPSNWVAMTSETQSGDPVLTGIDDAAKNSSWYVTLNHGVGGDWLSVDVSVVTAMFDRAIKDSLWVETYQNVAAYWRAKFTMDTVKAVSNATGWNVSWTSPHPKMPRSVPLIIKLDQATFGTAFFVYQNNKQISKRPDGSYLIEFMDKALTITKNITDVKLLRREIAREMHPTISNSSIQFNEMLPDKYTFKIFNTAGKLFKQGTFVVENDVKGGESITLRGLPSGIFILRLTPASNPDENMNWQFTAE